MSFDGVNFTVIADLPRDDPCIIQAWLSLWKDGSKISHGDILLAKGLDDLETLVGYVKGGHDTEILVGVCFG